MKRSSTNSFFAILFSSLPLLFASDQGKSMKKCEEGGRAENQMDTGIQLVDVSTVRPKRGDSQLGRGEIDALKTEALALVSDKTKEGELTKEALSHLLPMTPKLQAYGLFWQVAAFIPDRQLVSFRKAIYESLRALVPKPGQPIDPEYKRAFQKAGYLRDPEVASIAFDQLPLVPSYHFPDKPIPTGWPSITPENTEHITHGLQGVLASTTVLYGDEVTVTKYRKLMLSAPPGLQRLMIWGLGRSPDPSDFDFLMALQKRITDPGIEDTLVRALNRMIVSMRSVAKYPELVSAPRRPKDPANLLAIAEECQVRLKTQNLTLELTPYD